MITEGGFNNLQWRSFPVTPVFAVHHHCPGKSLACPVLRRFLL